MMASIDNNLSILVNECYLWMDLIGIGWLVIYSNLSQ